MEAIGPWYAAQWPKEALRLQSLDSCLLDNMVQVLLAGHPVAMS